jgi:hypothetical protein
MRHEARALTLAVLLSHAVLQMTIGNLRLKLFTMLGTSPPNMRLMLQVGARD